MDFTKPFVSSLRQVVIWVINIIFNFKNHSIEIVFRLQWSSLEPSLEPSSEVSTEGKIGLRLGQVYAGSHPSVDSVLVELIDLLSPPLPLESTTMHIQG